MFHWLRKRSAFADHIDVLQSIMRSQEASLNILRATIPTLTSQIDYRNEIIVGLIDAMDNGTHGISSRPDDYMFLLVFRTDDRIAIKRGLQIVEDLKCEATYSLATAGSTSA